MYSNCRIVEQSKYLKLSKVEKIYENSLDLIPSPSPLVKIQIDNWRESLLEVIRQNIAG